jgi:TonB family protein
MLADAYPPKAAEEGVEGKAAISCRVTEEGRLSRCELVSEEPAGHGFGEAAVSLAPRFLMTPSLYTTEERKVRIPITFKLPEEEPVAEQPTPDIPAQVWIGALVALLTLARFLWKRRRAPPAPALAGPPAQKQPPAQKTPAAPPAIPDIVSEARRDWLRPWRPGR